MRWIRLRAGARAELEALEVDMSESWNAERAMRSDGWGFRFDDRVVRQRAVKLAETHRKRARTYGVETSLQAADIRCLIELSGGLCSYCLQPYSYPTIDHVVVLSAGGANAACNVVIACHQCNTAKGTKGVLSMVNRPQHVAEERQRLNAWFSECRVLARKDLG